MVLLAAAEVSPPFCQSPLHELWPHSDALCSLLQFNTFHKVIFEIGRDLHCEQYLE